MSKKCCIICQIFLLDFNSQQEIGVKADARGKGIIEQPSSLKCTVFFQYYENPAPLQRRSIENGGIFRIPGKFVRLSANLLFFPESIPNLIKQD